MRRNSRPRIARLPRLVGGAALSLFLAQQPALAQTPPPVTARAAVPNFWAQVDSPTPAALIEPEEDADAPPLSLDDAVRIALAHQPALAAARASLAATDAGRRGLDAVGIGGLLLARDLPVRRQQAALGVSAAAANLCQVERDTISAVRRTYFSVLYARAQQKLAAGTIIRIQATIRVGEFLLENKDLTPPDLSQVSVDRTKIVLQLAENRRDDARRGVARAKAALREAMGVGFCTKFRVPDAPLPEPSGTVDKEAVICAAVRCRGEVGQSSAAAGVVGLEPEAQRRIRSSTARTAASGADFHVKPLPAGSFGDTYSPAALGIELPPFLAGPKKYRVERAEALAGRAAAVAEKTQNLVALEAEDVYLRWESAIRTIRQTRKTLAETDNLESVVRRGLELGKLKSFRDLLEIQLQAAQVRAQYNEALYEHAYSLADLERVTGGAFVAVFAAAPPEKPAEKK